MPEDCSLSERNLHQKRRGAVTIEAVAGAIAFAASAAVVVWQNLRLTVLWDLSYILENASRMAGGDVPYRDFPFPYAPLTFAGQALIIRFAGRAVWHHTLYAACAGGVATVLAYVIVRRYVAQAAAMALTIPLIPLGIYAIFPHPFYDPDACLLALAVMVALLCAESGGARFAAGMAAVLTLFVKQNIGLAFVVAIAALSIAARDRRRSIPLLAGMAVGAALAFGAVAALFGIGNYVEWTIRFAASRRLPSLGEYAGIYADKVVWWWVLSAIAGVLFLRRSWLGSPRVDGADESRPGAAGMFLRIAGVGFIALPFVWTIGRIYATDDPTEREINLLRFWPMIIVCGVAAGVVWLWREHGGQAVVPLLAIATIAGAFLSQSAWGSTYGMWPMLIVTTGAAIGLICRGDARIESAIAAVVAAAFLFGGVPYVIDGERLTYVKLGGVVYRSTLRPLRGLSQAGEWLPEFEQLVAWTSAHIPRDDGIICIPGEDLFYFTSGRQPRFPVLMFDRTVNPYDARTIARLADEKQIRWLIVKKRLQLNGTPMENVGEKMRLLERRFGRVAELANYTIYRRLSLDAPTAKPSAVGGRGRFHFSAPRLPRSLDRPRRLRQRVGDRQRGRLRHGGRVKSHQHGIEDAALKERRPHLDDSLPQFLGQSSLARPSTGR
jgi:hypothetical protein